MAKSRIPAASRARLTERIANMMLREQSPKIEKAAVATAFLKGVRFALAGTGYPDSLIDEIWTEAEEIASGDDDDDDDTTTAPVADV